MKLRPLIRAAKGPIKASLMEKRSKHLLKVCDERKIFHGHIQESLRPNSQSLVIYLDGMDQQKTDIPRLRSQDVKETGSILKVRFVTSFELILFFYFRLIGGLLYRDSMYPFGFFFPPRFLADTNSNLECLRRILQSIGVDELREIIYIQLDNTSKDNKNWFLFTYLAALLIMIPKIKRIYVNFLPIGHTHGQIDQMFSKLANYLKHSPAKTFPELLYAMYKCFNNPGSTRKKKTIRLLCFLNKMY